MNTTNLLHIHIVFLQEFALDNKVFVTSHPKTVRKLDGWGASSDRILNMSAFITYKLVSHGILVSVQLSS